MREQLYKLVTYSAAAVLGMMIAMVITGHLSMAPAAEDDIAKN